MSKRPNRPRKHPKLRRAVLGLLTLFFLVWVIQAATGSSHESGIAFAVFGLVVFGLLLLAALLEDLANRYKTRR